METIGKVTDEIKQTLGINTAIESIMVHELNFKKHLVKRNHENMLKYFEDIGSFIKAPDYVGVNPREQGISLEYVKQIGENVLIGVKLSEKDGYFYIATMHEISNLKLTQRLNNGRLVKFDNKIDDDIMEL